MSKSVSLSIFQDSSDDNPHNDNLEDLLHPHLRQQQHAKDVQEKRRSDYDEPYLKNVIPWAKLDASVYSSPSPSLSPRRRPHRSPARRISSPSKPATTNNITRDVILTNVAEGSELPSFEEAGLHPFPAPEAGIQREAVKTLLQLDLSNDLPPDLQSSLNTVSTLILEYLGPPPVIYLMDARTIVHKTIEKLLQQHYFVTQIISSYNRALCYQVATSVWFLTDSFSRAMIRPNKDSRTTHYFKYLIQKQHFLHYLNCRIIYNLFRHEKDKLQPVITDTFFGLKQVEMNFTLWEIILKWAEHFSLISSLSEKFQAKTSCLSLKGSYNLLAIVITTSTGIFSNKYVPTRGRSMSLEVVSLLIDSLYKYSINQREVLDILLSFGSNISRAVLLCCEALFKTCTTKEEWKFVVKTLPILELISAQISGPGILIETPQLVERFEELKDIHREGSDIYNISKAILKNIENYNNKPPLPQLPDWCGRFQIWLNSTKFNGNLAKCFYFLDTKQDGHITESRIKKLFKTTNHPFPPDAKELFEYLSPPPNPIITLTQWRFLAKLFVDDPISLPPPKVEESGEKKKGTRRSSVTSKRRGRRKSASRKGSVDGEVASILSGSSYVGGESSCAISGEATESASASVSVSASTSRSPVKGKSKSTPRRPGTAIVRRKVSRRDSKPVFSVAKVATENSN